MLVCECCMLLNETGDDGACRLYYDHEHPRGTIPLDYIYDDTQDDYVPMHPRGKYVCDACGVPMLPMANTYTYFKFGQ